VREGVGDCRHQLSGVAMGMVWVAEVTAVGELVEAFGWAQATSKVPGSLVSLPVDSRHGCCILLQPKIRGAVILKFVCAENILLDCLCVFF